MIRALVLALAAVTLGGEAMAASFTLSEADKQAAIRAGERSITAEAFDREWHVSNGSQSVTVLTPFHRLAAAARNAAFKSAPITPGEVEKVLKQDSGRLVVWVHLRGKSEDFARYLAPRLVAGTREIRPVFVQNERTAVRQDDGAYLARCVYGFPVGDLDGRARVALMVNDVNGNETSRFTIDLSSMR